ncbi:MAG: shikimate dehydrogenase [Methanotrichaceae archaeon]
MKIYGIFGDPIGHSLSPTMQNAAFRALCLDACYHAFCVSKGQLRDAILGAKAMGFGGLNLTIPLKETALEIVQPDELARSIGAVNTVAFDQGIRGYNTDGMGALLALEDSGIRIKRKAVVIIGAGGAAKAIAYTLAKSEADITIINRNPDRAVELADHVGGVGYGLDSLERLVPKADVIINATSVGMSEEDPKLIERSLLHKGLIVFDVVYNRQTELLKDAANVGAITIDGVMMLVYQGAKALEIWTGLKAPVDIMEQAVREGLRKRAREQR